MISQPLTTLTSTFNFNRNVDLQNTPKIMKELFFFLLVCKVFTIFAQLSDCDAKMFISTFGILKLFIIFKAIRYLSFMSLRDICLKLLIQKNQKGKHFEFI